MATPTFVTWPNAMPNKFYEKWKCSFLSSFPLLRSDLARSGATQRATTAKACECTLRVDCIVGGNCLLAFPLAKMIFNANLHFAFYNSIRFSLFAANFSSFVYYRVDGWLHCITSEFRSSARNETLIHCRSTISANNTAWRAFQTKHHQTVIALNDQYSRICPSFSKRA